MYDWSHSLTGLVQPKAEVPTEQRPSGLAVSAGKGAARAPREVIRVDRRMMDFMVGMGECGIGMLLNVFVVVMVLKVPLAMDMEVYICATDERWERDCCAYYSLASFLVSSVWTAS